MTRENAKKLLPIITAYAEGKTIQINWMHSGWGDAGFPNFTLNPECYRIKPEPRIFDALISPVRGMLVLKKDASPHQLEEWAPIKLQEIID